MAPSPAGGHTNTGGNHELFTVTELAASRVAAERYLGWGRLAAGASLLVSLAADVIGGYAWFEVAAGSGGVILVALGLSTLLGSATGQSSPTRLMRVVGHAETVVFAGLLAVGADEDAGYVLVLAMLMLMLAALRGVAAHRAALYLAVGAELVRQLLHLLIGETIDPVESLVGLGLAAAVSSVLVRMVELARSSEMASQRSAATATTALAEAERAAAQLDVMHRVVLSGIGAGEAEALQRMVQEISAYLEVPAVTAFMLDDEQRPTVAATTDEHVAARDDVTPIVRGPFLHGPLERALQGLSTEATADELAVMATADLPRHGAITVHPLRRGDGTVVGALACGSPVGRTFGATEVRTVARFADQMGLAIEAARSLDREADLAARYRELDRLKTDFVAITSHELRTPLTTVMGVVETMHHHLDQLDRDEVSRLVDSLVRQATRLSRLVDDLRTVSRVDAGTLHAFNRPTDLATLLQEVVVALPTVDVQVTVDPGMPKVMADPDRLVQVVTNLVANGDQHGRGTVRVAARADEAEAAIEVWDEGPGVPPEHREDVFTRFVRLGDTDSHSRGTGLGLAIARELTTAMGGTIAVIDRDGRGVFQLRLPLTSP